LQGESFTLFRKAQGCFQGTEFSGLGHI
jgi:hypothetical protein